MGMGMGMGMGGVRPYKISFIILSIELYVTIRKTNAKIN